MKTVILLIISILLAIPTYGISILVFIFAKYKYDSFIARRVLINAVVMSYERNGENQIRYGVNDGAISMMFELCGGRVVNQLTSNSLTGVGSSFSGILPHPIKPVMLVATLTQVSGNAVLIKATELNLEDSI